MDIKIRSTNKSTCVYVNITRVIIIINLSNILNFYFFTKINLNLKGKKHRNFGSIQFVSFWENIYNMHFGTNRGEKRKQNHNLVLKQVITASSKNHRKNR